MRNFKLTLTVFLLAAVLFTIGCKDEADPVFKTVDPKSEEPNTTFDDPLALFTTWVTPPVTATIEGKTGGTVVGNSGITVSIAPYSLLDQDDNVIEGDVNVVLKEINSKAEMVFTGVGTMTSKEPLESGGMFNLTITENGKDVKLKTGATVYTTFATQNSNDSRMEIFRGVENDTTNVDWEPVNNIELQIDSTNERGAACFLDFLNWCNLDRFYNEYTTFTTNFNVVLPDDCKDGKTAVYMLFDGVGMTNMFSEDDINFTTGNYKIGIGMKATVLAVCIKDKVLKYQLIPVTVEDNQTVNADDMQRITEDDLKNIIKTL